MFAGGNWINRVDYNVLCYSFTFRKGHRALCHINCCMLLCPDQLSYFTLTNTGYYFRISSHLKCMRKRDDIIRQWMKLFCEYFIEFVATAEKGYFLRIDSLVVDRWWWWLRYWKPPRVSNHFLNMFSIFIALEFEFQLSTEHIFEICAINGIMRKTDCNWIALGGLKWNRSLHSGYFVTQNSLGRVCLGT